MTAMKQLLATICLLACLQTAAATIPQESLSLVVMIRTFSSDHPSLQSCGAGIVVANDDSGATVITAAHLISNLVSVPLDKLVMRIKFVGDTRWFDAEVPPNYVAAGAAAGELDLKVVFVRDKQRPDFSPASFATLRGADGATPRKALHVGHPSCAEWSGSTQPEPVLADSKNGIIEVQSNTVDDGSSGGALFDEYGSLLGMIIRDSGGVGKALPIERILDQLGQWKLATNLRPGQLMTRREARDRLQERGLRLTSADIVQSLQSGDIEALELLTNAGITPEQLASGLRMRASSPELFPATALLQSTARNERAVNWLKGVLAAGLDPNLVVPSKNYDETSLVAIALSMDSADGVIALLEAGANPHPYQLLDGGSDRGPRFVYPLLYAAGYGEYSDAQRRRVVTAMLNTGAVVPAFISMKDGYRGEVMNLAEQNLRLLAVVMGQPVPPSVTLQQSTRSVACDRATRRDRFDWCAWVARVPKHIETLEKGWVGPLRSAELRYLLGIGNGVAHFLAFFDNDGAPDYALINVTKDGRWTLNYFYKDMTFMPRCKLYENEQPKWCWRRMPLNPTQTPGIVRFDGWGTEFALKP